MSSDSASHRLETLETTLSNSLPRTAMAIWIVRFPMMQMVGAAVTVTVWPLASQLGRC